jgi:hypothetical protein
MDPPPVTYHNMAASPSKGTGGLEEKYPINECTMLTRCPPQTLTICYHVTHQKINIRKETSTSVNVFSIASYITMVVLLAHMQTYQSDYPIMPVVSRGNHLWEEAKHLVAHAKALIHEYAER